LPSGLVSAVSVVSAGDVHDALPLSTASFHILLALADGDSHGYTIGKDVDAQTHGAVKLGPTTLYRTIKQLLADGWITEITGKVEPGDDERRRYYRLTPRGRRIAEAEARRLAELVTVARARRLLPAGAFV
jgi:DNA-binding PadR family transcriptional regulator